MASDTALHMQIGAALLLFILSLMLIALQLDRFDAYKRQIALSSIAVFLSGATAIWYLEEIKALLWEDPPIAQLARGTAREGVGQAIEEARGGGAGASRGAAAAQQSQSSNSASLPARIDKRRFQECFNCPEMVIIPAGNDGAPIAGFAIGRFELTVAEYHAFVAKTGHTSSPRCEAVSNSPRHAPAYLQPGFAEIASRPVACISLEDAKAYLTWLSVKTGQTYRLPTPREWSHAARGGQPVATVALLGQVQRASFSPATSAALNIASASSNGYGVFDMAGNVAEWIEGGQAMGGSWADGDSIVQVRSAGSSGASATIGVRVVRDLPRD